MRNRLFIFLLVFLFAGGCGVAILPKPDQTGEVDLRSRIITKKVGGITVSVQTNEWQFNPSELEQFYTPFLLLIKNGTEQKVAVNLKSIYLVDTLGNQSQPLPPIEVERTLADRGYIVTPSAHIGIGTGGHSSFLGLGFDFPLQSPRPLGSDISPLSLPEGEILPGAAVRGFVYFKRISTAGESLKLHIEINQAAEDFYFILKR